MVARKNIQTYKYGEKQQKAKEKTANKCRLHVTMLHVIDPLVKQGAMINDHIPLRCYKIKINLTSRLIHSVKPGIHYPLNHGCLMKPVFTAREHGSCGQAPVFTGIQNVNREHGPWTRVSFLQRCMHVQTRYSDENFVHRTLLLSPQRGLRNAKRPIFRAKSHFAWRKSATKFLCAKTVSGKVVRHSLA